MYVSVEVVKDDKKQYLFTWSFLEAEAYETSKSRINIPGVVYDDNKATISKINATKQEYNYLYNLCEHYEIMYW